MKKMPFIQKFDQNWRRTPKIFWVLALLCLLGPFIAGYIISHLLPSVRFYIIGIGVIGVVISLLGTFKKAGDEFIVTLVVFGELCLGAGIALLI